jgi:hypothetical protein
MACPRFGLKCNKGHVRSSGQSLKFYFVCLRVIIIIIINNDHSPEIIEVLDDTPL